MQLLLRTLFHIKKSSHSLYKAAESKVATSKFPLVVPMESVCSHHEAALQPHLVRTQVVLLLWYNLHDVNRRRKPVALLQHL